MFFNLWLLIELNQMTSWILMYFTVRKDMPALRKRVGKKA